MVAWRSLRVVAVFVVLALVGGCAPTLPKYDYASEPDPRNAEWILGVGDQISINVWENPGLTTEATIRPDGNITMPLVGDLHAVGETPSSLKAMIRGRLTDFVKLGSGSEITVAVRGANSYRFTIVGEVTRPGVVQLGYYVTVVEAIAMAGGFTRFAGKNSIKLLRRDPKTGVTRTIPIAYDFLADGSHPEMNLVMMTGDALFVP
ncbi:MAG: polysaccharide biosynthesis/export family protein [Myxococcales bacterium]|nr:polysaccharide biosynthesis/export family protein [Myxococcales bacterium]